MAACAPPLFWGNVDAGTALIDRHAAAGSGRMPNAPGSSTWVLGGDAADDVLGW
jgi:hypothetical protein